MIRNYLTVALRSIWRSKFYSFINITGLATGIACCLLISLYLKDEWTFDRFHTKAHHIYRAYVKEDYGDNEKFFNTVTPFPLAPLLRETFPEVEDAIRINSLGSQVKTTGEQFEETITIADPGFFDVFDFPFEKGSAQAVLASAGNVVITEDIATKYFGSDNPIDKTLAIRLGENFEDYIIKGVAKRIPTNSSVRFGILISSLNYPKLYSERALTSGWFNVTPETYVLLNESTKAEALTQKFPPLFKDILGEEFARSNYFVGLQPLTDIHLNPDYPAGNAPVSDPRYSYILAVVALLILVLGSINFVTLSIGQTIKRSREVGIRKVVGAVRRQLITQFIGEAILVTLLALLVGGALAGVSIPVFNELSAKNLILEPDAFISSVAVALLLFIGLFAGSYPAFVLSGFKPIQILKGKLEGSGKQTLRKILVSVQLVLAIFLVSTTLIMQKQLHFLQETDLGFRRDNVVAMQLTVPQNGGLGKRVNAGFEKAALLKQAYASIPAVLSVTAASHDFGNGQWTEIGYTDEKDVYRVFYANLVDADFIPAMEIELVAGRNFINNNQADARNGIIVNEAFVREYGWDDPIGKRIPGKAFIDHEIIGVVKDFNYESLYQKVRPLVMAINPEIVFSGSENVMMDNSPIPKLFVRLKAGETSVTLTELEQRWKKVAGADSFSFSFVDERIDTQYRNDKNLSKVISVSTVLAIMIGGLGLYGLASLAIQGRVKEVSIRKVLGASTSSLLVLLSKEFLVMIILTLTLSVPLTLYIAEKWLQSFAYKVDIGPGIFLATGLVSLAIAMVTISSQVFKTVLSQPAETLKSE